MSAISKERAVALTTTKRTAEVIIVGAGAVGLLTALKLGRAGVETIVLESHNDILQAPRAIAYMPIVSEELRKIGIFQKLQGLGMMNTTGVTWRRPDGEELATLPPGTEVLTLGQDKVSKAILDTLREECPSVEIIFGQRCVGISEDDGFVDIMTNGDQDDHLFRAKFVVGCDGANSAVRRMSMISFEGFTWRNFRFTAADVEYDFANHCGLPVANFIVDNESWAVVAKTGKENIWRVCYGERADLPTDAESLHQRAKSRITQYIEPVNRSGNFDFRIRRLQPYWAHQRCAAVYRKGNILLAGDAAHSNNPIGGLGLTGGILDAVAVGNALVRHLIHGEPDDLITKAMTSRRDTWLNVTNPVSQGNFRRLFSDNDGTKAERDFFFKKINEQDHDFLQKMASFLNLLPETFE